ncbi:MAG: hypothetical protein V1837_08095 [Candidatus Woesearchaeota archaeon]
MGAYTDLLKRYFPFTENETKAFIISVLALTLIVSFNDRAESFSLAHWLGNFLIWLVIVAISLFVHHAGHRLLGLKVGNRVEYQLWWYGLLVGLIVMFVTRGRIWLLIPGGILIHHMPIQRLGRFRYGPNVFSLAMIALFGPLASIALALLVKTPQVWFNFALFGPTFVENVYIFNLAIAAYALLPIPPLAGSRIFFASRPIYILIATAVIAYALLAYAKIYSALLAILIGVIVWAVFVFQFEKGAWKFE